MVKKQASHSGDINIDLSMYTHTYGVLQLNSYCHGNSFLPSLLKSAGSLRGSV